jgi:hypothetical protein
VAPPVEIARMDYLQNPADQGRYVTYRPSIDASGLSPTGAAEGFLWSLLGGQVIVCAPGC